MSFCGFWTPNLYKVKACGFDFSEEGLLFFHIPYARRQLFFFFFPTPVTSFYLTFLLQSSSTALAFHDDCLLFTHPDIFLYFVTSSSVYFIQPVIVVKCLPIVNSCGKRTLLLAWSATLLEEILQFIHFLTTLLYHSFNISNNSY